MLLAALAVTVGGCALMPGSETQEPAPAVKADAPAAKPELPESSDSLLLYYQHLRRLPAAGVGREHDIARTAYGRARSDYNRVRLAMVLALPGTPASDDARALELLEPVARNPNAELQGLAYLLVSHVQERRRLDANAQSLQQKLDALKSLERAMIERKRK